MVGVLALFFINPPVGKDTEVRFDNDLLQPIDAESLQQKIKESDAEVKLVNIWATWCVPCIEEFPYLIKLRKMYSDKGLELILVSADFQDKLEGVYQFLEQMEVDFKTYIKDGDSMSFIETMHPEWSGALPATFIYDHEGDLLQFWMGDASFEEFEAAVLEDLNQKE